MQRHAISFAKMHGLGNDFVVIDSRGADARVTPALARALGDRHTGVGFDQLAELRGSARADLTLDFWNSDGSRAGACGNATRCVAATVMAETGRESVTIETERGLLSARMTDQGISVNMGQPQLTAEQIPLSEGLDPRALPFEGSPVAVGMGNPHCVFFVDDAASTDPAQHGPEVEHHPAFPQGTNVEFATAIDRATVRMRVWERGTGITRACGSGACATAVAGHLLGLIDRTVRMELDGGWLTLDWREDGVWMTGPTARVFDGVLSPDWLAAI